MADGTNNLKPVRTEEEARELGRRGGIASGKARLRKKHGKELVRAILGLTETDPRILDDMKKLGLDESDITNEVVMHMRQIEKAKRKADTFAYNSVNKAAGYDEQNINLGGGSFNIVVGTPEAAEGLQRALATGAQPTEPEE